VADSTISLSTPISSQPSMFRTANDVLFIAGVGLDTNSQSQVYVTVINGTTATQVTLGTATTSATTTAYTVYTYSILGTYAVDSAIYVMWSSAFKCHDSSDGTSQTCTSLSKATTNVYSDIYVQGVWGNASKVWTTAANPLTASTATAMQVSGVITSDLSSSATKLYVAWRASAATTAAAGNVQMNSITISSGTAGSASTLVSDILPTASVAAGVLYTPVGGFASTSTYGIGLGATWLTWDTTVSPAAISATKTYGASVCLNASTTPTSVANFSTATMVSYVTGTAYGNSSFAGFALGYGYTSGTSPVLINLATQEFYQNGTAVQTSPVAFMSIQTGGAQNLFMDQSNNWWFGYTTYDVETAGTAPFYTLKGYVGKLIATVYSSGNFLTSTIAFLFFVVATLFTF